MLQRVELTDPHGYAVRFVVGCQSPSPLPVHDSRYSVKRVPSLTDFEAFPLENLIDENETAAIIFSIVDVVTVGVLYMKRCPEAVSFP